MNDKILSIHQPNYWPYPGLLAKINLADAFMYMSNVKLNKRSWQTRNKIKSSNGTIFLTVPIFVKGKFFQNISEVQICNDRNWQNKTLNTIKSNYHRAPYFEKIFSDIEGIYLSKWENLNSLNIYITNFLLDKLNIKTKIFYDTDFNFVEHKTDLLIAMCLKTGYNTYISNKGSQAYVKIDKFTNKKLNHLYVDWICPRYLQLFGEFVPNLSILDMLFNCGYESTEKIVKDKNNFRFSNLNQTF